MKYLEIIPDILSMYGVYTSQNTSQVRQEMSTICYKYNKPIRNTIFNFNKLVSDLDIHANTPKS